MTVLMIIANLTDRFVDDELRALRVLAIFWCGLAWQAYYQKVWPDDG